MLAALNLGALVLGTASGALVASVLGLVVGGGLTLLGADWGADVGLMVGVLTGLGVAGWVSGSKAVHSERFHGALSGLVLAFLVMIIARMGGSTAGTPVIVWLAVLSIVVGGLAGWLAGRRTNRTV